MINVGIVGITGYTGEELIAILIKHPHVKITGAFSRSVHLKPLSEVFPKFDGRVDLTCLKPDIKAITKNTDLVFLAVPHTTAMDLAPQLLKAGKRVIDLSADYRFKDAGSYEKFYKVKHKDKKNLANAVYGLPELYRNKIKDAFIVANPGCYPTCAILSLAPLAAIGGIDFDSIIIDAKSGVSGAGRKLEEGFLFSEANGNFKAYKVNNHQHMPEIEQVLSKLAGKKIKVTFVPHLLPVNRGILETIYVKKSPGQKSQDLVKLYKKFYKNEPFVRIREEGDFPQLKDVVNTNFCDICVKEEKDKLIIVSVIDNLVKGASGQAVQNMNIMYGFPEKTALV